MIVELTAIEQRLAIHMAKTRRAVNRAAGRTDLQQGKQSPEDIELDGIAAEIAFCKLFNVYPDLQNEELHSADAVTPKMGRVDIKTTRYKSGKLICYRGKKGREADSYALMIGQFPKFQFVGWATSKELLDDENLIDVGHGPFFAMPQERLRAET